jgi:signal transduction histidine kinase
MVEEMVRYAGQMPGSPVPIRTELGETPVVEGDPIQIRQMLLNLVLNAVEATRDVGTLVTVRTGTITGVDEFPRLWLFEPRRAERYCVVEIADDGPGMDPETLGRIFDPFFTTKETGNGLGLASVLGTIQSHSGAISVESEPGRGSTFTVVFPAR